MEDRLRKENHLSQLTSYVKTSHYRYPFYKQYKTFYDNLVEKDVFSQFKKKQTTLLYAPTWQDLQSSSSLFEVGTAIIKQLPDHYNLIVKLHPWIDHHQQGFVTMLKEKYQSKPNVVILSLYPLVLPLLHRADMYLGDFSSISYDYLYYNRPMFFFDPKERKEKEKKESTLIHDCGVRISEDKFASIFTFIEQNKIDTAAIKEKREKLFRYTFGKDKPFDAIKTEIIEKTKLYL